ncbi:Nitroreductase [Archaeoglobus sulfaticallidus PM70-1]|uniref:Nitroreductase n=1 Tax=Archaeoglobus sulfaticallidus PM70-1 TaxID=387631 RepID=N0BEH4_9EURY|nr:nitroreductase family protein [Archaeoglobus sulfaticallidus]AGK62009.1 Nitroreductase [Archaeoglobus sulfaticallidus PM70-1]
MTSFFEVILKRRSIRKFRDQEVEEDKIRKIVEAGIWAPSAGNMQPWVFVVVRNKKNIEKIKAMSPGMFDLPAVIIAVCRDMGLAGNFEENISIFDVAMAAQNMLLMACDLGLGACPVRSFNQKAVQVLLDLPEHIVPELLVTLGYPDESPSPPERRKGVVFLEKYGGDGWF